MRLRKLIAETIGTGLLATAIAAPQAPTVSAVDEKLLREYTGVYQWEGNGFIYLQMWDEFSGFGQPKLLSFDENPVRFGRFIRLTATGSSPALAPRFRRP